MQLTSQESRLLYLTKRHGPQDITTVTLKRAADRLIDWQLAKYNGASRLEYVSTETLEG